MRINQGSADPNVDEVVKKVSLFARPATLLKNIILCLSLSAGVDKVNLNRK